MDATWLSNFVLFAAQNADGKGAPPWWATPWPLLIMIGFMFYLLLIRPQQRERAKRQAMLNALKKNDRVIAAGGIYGVVAEVDREANRVTVKVDEAANVRLRVTLSSVIPIPPDQPSDDKPSSK